MRLILSPAMKMQIANDVYLPTSVCVFEHRALELRRQLAQMDFNQLKELWKCSDNLVASNMKILKGEYKPATPALLAYVGLGYQYMAPNYFEYSAWDYAQEHFRILSAFYGVLKPTDAVALYRLEMSAKLSVGGSKNLYEYWGSALHDEVYKGDSVAVNLTSHEYSKCISKYVTPQERLVNVMFGQVVGGKVKEKATYAKMARGEMARYAAEINAKTPEDLKSFNRLGFAYREDLSLPDMLVFIGSPLTAERNKA